MTGPMASRSTESDDWPRGTKFVMLVFDQTVVPRHPKTGEMMPPPDSLTALCRPESIGWTRARLTALANSTGWKAELQESYLWKEDEVGD